MVLMISSPLFTRENSHFSYLILLSTRQGRLSTKHLFKFCPNAKLQGLCVYPKSRKDRSAEDGVLCWGAGCPRSKSPLRAAEGGEQNKHVR